MEHVKLRPALDSQIVFRGKRRKISERLVPLASRPALKCLGFPTGALSDAEG